MEFGRSFHDDARSLCRASRRRAAGWLRAVVDALRTRRQGRAGLGSHERNVDCIDEAIDIHILSEVRGSHGLAGLIFRYDCVADIFKSVGVRVSDQNIHSRCNAWQNRARRVLNVAKGDNEMLRVCHVVEIDDDLVRIRSNARVG